MMLICVSSTIRPLEIFAIDNSTARQAALLDKVRKWQIPVCMWNEKEGTSEKNNILTPSSALVCRDIIFNE